LLGLLVLVGVGLFYGTSLFRGDGSSEPAPAATFAYEAQPAPAATVAPTNGQVTLVATDEVWLRVYDTAGKTLHLKTMAAGERYDSPADADGPMINVGRPDKLQILVNGSQVAPLGSGRVAIKDVGVSAAALLARNQPSPAPSAAPVTGAAPARAPAAANVPPAFRAPTQAQRPAEPAPFVPPVAPPAEPAAAPGNSNEA
jgi:hypothetical protein